jgi:hypothetical protein
MVRYHHHYCCHGRVLYTHGQARDCALVNCCRERDGYCSCSVRTFDSWCHASFGQARQSQISGWNQESSRERNRRAPFASIRLVLTFIFLYAVDGDCSDYLPLREHHRSGSSFLPADYRQIHLPGSKRYSTATANSSTMFVLCRIRA